jgi:hypothetical protein
MFEDKVAHNLWKEGWVFYLSLCQIWADDNASTGAFTMGNYYWWNSRNNSIGLHLLITCRIFINILICWLFSVNIVAFAHVQSTHLSRTINSHNKIINTVKVFKTTIFTENNQHIKILINMRHVIKRCKPILLEFMKKYIAGLFTKRKKECLIRIGFRQLSFRQQKSHLIL